MSDLSVTQRNFDRPAAPFRRGARGGACSNAFCDNTGADWLNRVSAEYYCDACARWINELCLKQGIHKVCELHLGPHA